MDATRWVLLVLGAAAAVGYVAWWYRTREEPVAGRLPAAVFRAAALTLAWLILLNPKLESARDEGRVVLTLLDSSYSLSRPETPELGSLWRTARDSAAQVDAVWLFGGETPRRVHRDSLPDEPLYSDSRLTPGIRAVAAAGARRARVISDGRIADLLTARQEARRLGVSLSFVPLLTDYPEYGIARVDGPPWARLGDTVDVTLEIVTSGRVPDTLAVDVVDESESALATGWVATAGEGRYATERLRVPVRGVTGLRRYVARLAPATSDPETGDNHRALYLRVSERPPGPVLISLRPDWEPSFIAPVLDRLTDSPASVYLWFAGEFLEVGSYQPLALEEVVRRARDAPLLILHGYGADAPGWARQLAAGAARLALWPVGDRAFQVLGHDIRVGPPASGEWYASESRPSSRLALDLAGIDVANLPPLVRTRPVDAESEWEWVPLDVQLLRRGEPRPAVVAGRSELGRWVVATAEGYWRWAFRPGPGRQLYRALWTGLGGWLLEGRERVAAGPGPVRRVVERDEPLIWPAPPEADSLALALRSEGEDRPRLFVVAGGDTAFTRLPPGRYRYRTRLYRDGSRVASGEGRAEVEEFSRELLPRAPDALDQLEATPTPAPTGKGGRPLAASWWPYLVVMALFCAEWTTRRLTGLR